MDENLDLRETERRQNFIIVSNVEKKEEGRKSSLGRD